jgi:Bifunctional DNA primase/polymerase, N-terminal
MSGLRIPPFAGDADNLTAALAYAEAGWYVGPLRLGLGEREGKNPGDYLGDDWDQKTSRNPDVITAWFNGRDDLGVFLHVGRSGGWVADVDKPAKIPDVLERSVSGAPFQATRPTTDPARGHYVFTAPPGRRLGNSTGNSVAAGVKPAAVTPPGWADGGAVLYQLQAVASASRRAGVCVADGGGGPLGP